MKQNFLVRLFSEAENDGLRKKFLIVFQFMFFAVITLNYVLPITDPDFPWHLKTGQYIVEHNEIPYEDPFLSTSEHFSTMREKFIVSQYWLAQVVFAKIYKWTDVRGLVLFEAFIYGAIFLVLWSILSRKGLLSAYIIVAMMAIIMKYFAGFRPQFFTFLFIPLLVMLLDGYLENRKANKKYLIFLPLLMLVWSNMHGGFIYGVVLIVLFVMGSSIQALRSRDGNDQKNFLLFCFVCFISILVSYINPNGYQALIVAIQPDYALISGRLVREYTPLVDEFYNDLAYREIFLFWIILAYVLIVMSIALIRREVRARDLLLTVVSLYIATTAIRFMPLFMLTALPLTQKYRNEMRLANGKAKITIKVLAVLIVILLFSHLVRQIPFHRLQSNFSLRQAVWYPARGVQFLKQNKIEGIIYNSHHHGGYLVYKLFPEYKVFSDSRSLYPQVMKDEYAIEDALRYPEDKNSFLYALVDVTSNKYPKAVFKKGDYTISKSEESSPGPEYWGKLLDKYKIDIIFHRAVSPFSGNIYPLTLRLINNNKWELIYFDGSTTIFVRNIEKFRDIIRKHGKDKTRIFDEIILENLPIRNKSYASIAYSFIMTGYYKLGEEFTEKALQANENDQLANFCKILLQLQKTDAGASGGKTIGEDLYPGPDERSNE